MKKAMLVLAALAFSFGTYAQDGKMPKKDHVMMKDGKMWVMKDGKTMTMTKDMTMSDGTMVSTNGTVTMKDGSTKMMVNGDGMMMDGMMMDHSTKKGKSKTAK